MTGPAAVSATLAAIAALLAAGGVRAGASLYDMNPLLDEPHPFAAAPPPLLTAPGRTGGANRLYDMNPLLDAPHPFDVAPAAGPAATGPPAPTAPTPAPPAAAPRPAPPEPAARRPAAPRASSAAAVQTADRGGARPVASEDDTGFVQFALGYYDINDNEGAAEFRAEWRGAKWVWAVRPMAGLMASSDAAVYLYGGILFDVYLGRRVVLSPSFAAGLYEDGGGKDLGSVIEFRSALELAWRLDDGSRIGLSFYHLSNAGIDDNNPGTEVLSLGYAVPLN